VKEDTEEDLRNEKVYKIKYTVNILPIIGEHIGDDGSFQRY